MPTRFPAPLTVAELRAIPDPGDDDLLPIAPFASPLIWDNPHLVGVAEGGPLPDDASAGQRLLYVLDVFVGEVHNGGVTQFLWNRPDLVEDVRDALRVVGTPELREAYGRVLGQLAAKASPWVRLRRAFTRLWRRDPGGMSAWAPFQQSYDLLDLGWFDEAWFDTWEHDAFGGRRRLAVGWGRELEVSLIAWIRAHPDEFVAT